MGYRCAAEVPNENSCLRNGDRSRILRAMHRHSFSVEAKKKLWRPCREARALGL